MIPHVVQKAVSSFGPPIVVRSKLAAVLSLMVMAALHNSLTVMPSVRCFSVTGEYQPSHFSILLKHLSGLLSHERIHI